MRVPSGESIIRVRGLVNLPLIALIIAAILISGVWQPGIEFHLHGTTIALQNILRPLQKGWYNTLSSGLTILALDTYGTQAASVNIAVDKARSSARFKRPTKALQDVVAAGGDGLRILGLPGAVPVEGGVPILVDGKIVGAIGMSGGTSAQDGQCANVGAAAVK